MFELYEPVMHNVKGKGRIIGFTGSFSNPFTVELESGGTCLAGAEELASLGKPPEKPKPKGCPEAIKQEPITFLEGDPVPKWVWEAEDPDFQKCATFATDVRVSWKGRVVVEQLESASPVMYELINLTAWGKKTNWKGYPTEFRPKLKPEEESEGKNDRSGD